MAARNRFLDKASIDNSLVAMMAVGKVLTYRDAKDVPHAKDVLRYAKTLLAAAFCRSFDRLAIPTALATSGPVMEEMVNNAG